MKRSDAQRLDAEDALAPLRQAFDIPEGGPIYMDGNSLGRPPRRVVEAVRAGVEEWARALVGGWDRWIGLPLSVGDRLGRLIGAAPGQVAVCDSTTVNLFKVVSAAVRAAPERRVIVGDVDDFPTDRYVLEGIASGAGCRVRWVRHGGDPDRVESSLNGIVDASAAVVCLSDVNYRSGARVDVPLFTDIIHRSGALAVWDLCHSVGALPHQLDEWGVDAAVGCTYKYLNSGPGSPGWIYVNRSLQERLRQPIWGWFGTEAQFEMGPQYRPGAGIRSWLTGTPGVLGLIAVEAALSIHEEVGIDRLWAKSQGLTRLLFEQHDEVLAPLGVGVATPRPPHRRGAHVAFTHERAWAWSRALIDRGLVVGDFRAPDVLRIAPAPLYTSHTECWEAVEAMAAVLRGGLADIPDPEPSAVT